MTTQEFVELVGYLARIVVGSFALLVGIWVLAVAVFSI